MSIDNNKMDKEVKLKPNATIKDIVKQIQNLTK